MFQIPALIPSSNAILDVTGSFWYFVLFCFSTGREKKREGRRKIKREIEKKYY